MYAYIIGKVTYASLGAVVLENNGIGYQIFCSEILCGFYTLGYCFQKYVRSIGI